MPAARRQRRLTEVHSFDETLEGKRGVGSARAGEPGEGIALGLCVTFAAIAVRAHRSLLCAPQFTLAPRPSAESGELLTESGDERKRLGGRTTRNIDFIGDCTKIAAF
jgi:hypothetical protein